MVSYIPENSVLEYMNIDYDGKNLIALFSIV